MPEQRAPTLQELRERREAHQRYLDRNTRFLSVKQLAERWNCSRESVRMIPFVSLPWINIGSGLQRESRRYDPDAVLAYEAHRLERR